MRYLLLCIVLFLAACTVEEEIFTVEPKVAPVEEADAAEGASAFVGQWITTFQGRKIVVDIPEEGEATVKTFGSNHSVEKMTSGSYTYDPDKDEIVIDATADTGREELVIRLRKPRNELVMCWEPKSHPEHGISVVVAPASAEVIAGLEVKQQKAIPAHLRASCQNHLKQMGLVFKMYANESKGEVWPAIDVEKKSLTPAGRAIYPEYLTDVSVMICPADEDLETLPKPRDTETALQCIDDHSYWYFGYQLPDEVTALKFLEHYMQILQTGGSLTEDIQLDGDIVIERLNSRIDQTLIPDINNNSASSAIKEGQIPVLVERPGNHDNGGNVLFMDGHVEFIKYPGKYPMTEKVIKALLALDAL